jgi:hypothetical protein
MQNYCSHVALAEVEAAAAAAATAAVAAQRLGGCRMHIINRIITIRGALLPSNKQWSV